MRRLRRDDRGFTLVELVAATVLGSGVAWVVNAVT